MSNPLILALDLEPDKVLELAKNLDPEKCKLKVGSRLFTATGPSIVSDLRKLGFDIFLDLKFHDIPNTVYSALLEACKLKVWMVNIHCSGGSEMMKAARQAIADSNTNKPPLLIGVTVLTSLDQDDVKFLFSKKISQYTLELTKLAKDNGLDGVVCSPQEVKDIKLKFGKKFIAVTPGIRSLGPTGDQKRITSAQEALRNGSDYLVVGRPITESDNPVKSVESFLEGIRS